MSDLGGRCCPVMAVGDISGRYVGSEKMTDGVNGLVVVYLPYRMTDAVRCRKVVQRSMLALDRKSVV